MIADCHSHAGPSPGVSAGAEAARFARFLRRARAAGIGHTVVFPHFHPDYRRANRALARIVGRDPRRLTGFAFVHAARDAGRVGALLREARGALGLRGIKVHRRDARLGPEICRAARALGLPLLYDPMGEVAPAARLARRFETVRFILPHLGSFDDDPGAQRRCIELARELPNVFLDSSGVRHFDMLRRAVVRAGPDKLLFGSDGPWLHPALELAKVRALGLSPEAERRVLGGNLARLLTGSPPPDRPRPAPRRRSSPAAAGSRAR